LCTKVLEITTHSVLLHSGATILGGHWVLILKHDGKWYSYNCVNAGPKIHATLLEAEAQLMAEESDLVPILLEVERSKYSTELAVELMQEGAGAPSGSPTPARIRRDTIASAN
jgi:hypothetical protein